MGQEQKRAGEDLEASGRLAGGVSWQGVRTTALDLIERFCNRTGIDPAQFLSAQGWIRGGNWQGNVDWRGLANTRFDDFVRQNIREGGIGLNQFTFTRGLESRARPAEETVPRRPAAEQRETAPAPARQPASEARAEDLVAPLTRRSWLSTDNWSRLYSDAETALDRLPALTEEHRTAIHGILDRCGTESERRLVAVNLTTYLRYLSSDLHIITDTEATQLYDSFMSTNPRSPGLVLQAEARRRDEATARAPEPTRMATAEGRERPAPARTESHVYRVTVLEPVREEGGSRGPMASVPMPAQGEERPMRTLSTFEVVSPVPIESTTDLVTALRERPAGLAVTRIGAGGRRIRIQGDQLDTFTTRMGQLRFDPNHEIAITEQQGGRPRI